MSNISEFNAVSNAQTDHEHTVLLGLLQELCNPAPGNSDPAALGEILEGLIAYCEAHFTSEELLMRLKSYDEYEDHLDDHEHMLEVMQQIAADHAAGKSVLIPGKAQEILAFTRQHIDTRDKRLADYVRNGQ